ncbi:hypothetical protein Y032_0272g946 [Ancylostoma ceylanicum]|uniref:Uncharacterized protein n=1 Tax=Ancylostoma ceylanicum TaxID=53326 RepID=A0A016S892_9BILA|nr:hypothetical protein Y032_0272g946 [Ancylostoma ceylanicum]
MSQGWGVRRRKVKANPWRHFHFTLQAFAHLRIRTYLLEEADVSKSSALSIRPYVTIEVIVPTAMMFESALLRVHRGHGRVYSELFAHGGPTVHPWWGVGWPPRACVNPPRE